MFSRIQNFPLGTSPAWYHLPSGSLLQSFPHIKPMYGFVYFGDPMVRFLILKFYVKKQIGTVRFLQIAYSAFERHA